MAGNESSASRSPAKSAPSFISSSAMDPLIPGSLSVNERATPETALKAPETETLQAS